MNSTVNSPSPAFPIVFIPFLTLIPRRPTSHSHFPQQQRPIKIFAKQKKEDSYPNPSHFNCCLPGWRIVSSYFLHLYPQRPFHQDPKGNIIHSQPVTRGKLA